MNSSEETESSIEELSDEQLASEDGLFLARIQKYWLPTELSRIVDTSLTKEFGRFRIQDCLGRGGFGIVYLAYDPSSSRNVALKIPIIETVEKKGCAARFLVEVRAIASLQHEYIVPLLDAGEVDGIAYLAMQYCPMGTLANWIRRQVVPVEPRVAAGLVRAICSAVGYAHDKGIVHRDLKPANVLLTEGSVDSPLREIGLEFIPLVSDFGMAKILGWDESSVKKDQLTRTGTRMGTPCYMPPEHATGRAKESVPTADVYALGVMLYEILLGSPPFMGRSEYEVLHKVVSKDPPRMRRLRPEIPGPLEFICMKCLEKEPLRRYVNASQLGEDLTRFLEGRRLANQPWMQRTTVVKLKLSIVACCIALLLGALTWMLPYVRLSISSTEKMAGTTNSDSYGSSLDYATAVEKALPTPAGFVDETARQFLDSSDFTNKYRDSLAFEWRFARQASRDDRFRTSHSGESWALAYSPDGKWMAENSNEAHINLWNVETESLVKRLNGRRFSTYTLAFSSDSRWLASSEQYHELEEDGFLRSVQVWDLDRLAPMWKNGLQAHIQRVSGITFSADNQWIYLYGRDFGFKSSIWKCNVETAEIAWKWSSSQGMVYAVAESEQEERLWLVQAEGANEEPIISILALDSSSMETTEIIPSLSLPLGYAKFSGDGSLLILGECDPLETQRILKLHLFDIPTKRKLGQFEEPGGGFEAICFERATDHFYVIGASSFEADAVRVLRRWDADRKQLTWIRTLAPGPKTNRMTMHPLSDTLVLRRFLDARIYYLELNRNGIQEIEGHYPKEAWSVDFSVDGQRILTGGDDGLARVWDVKSGKLLDQFDAHAPKLVTDASFMPGSPNRAATGSYDKTVQIWNVLSQNQSVQNLPHESLVKKLAFTPDGASLLTVADDLFVRSWNATTGELRWKSPTGIRKLKGLCLHPSGKEVAVAGNDGVLRVLSVENGASIATAESSSSEIWSVIFSPLEEAWLVCTNAGVIEKFQGVGSKLEPWGLSSSGVRTMAISPDGKTLVSANTAGEIELWQVATKRRIGLLDRVDEPVYDLEFSPDGDRLAAALHDGCIRIWVAPKPQ